jgi:uncharacterized protein (DUF1778 family)
MLQGFFDRPRAVGIEHDPGVVSGGLDRRRDHRHRDFVQLDPAIAFANGAPHRRRHRVLAAVAHEARIDFDTVCVSAAQQVDQRAPAGLAGKIPQRDVDRGNAVHDRSDATEVVQIELEVVLDARDLLRIAAENQRQHAIIDHLLEGAVLHARESLAPADDTVLRLEAHKQNIEGVGRGAAPTPGRQAAALERYGEKDGLGFDDLHPWGLCGCSCWLNRWTPGKRPFTLALRRNTIPTGRSRPNHNQSSFSRPRSGRRITHAFLHPGYFGAHPATRP